MGKPYSHKYFFAGDGSSAGTMICRACGQPIYSDKDDWMSYKKSKSGDWEYHCFHRKCRNDQSPWIKIEENNARMKQRSDDIDKMFLDLARKLGVTDPYEFAEMAASALGGDIEEHFFGICGSC